MVRIARALNRYGSDKHDAQCDTCASYLSRDLLHDHTRGSCYKAHSPKREDHAIYYIPITELIELNGVQVPAVIVPRSIAVNYLIKTGVAVRDLRQQYGGTHQYSHSRPSPQKRQGQEVRTVSAAPSSTRRPRRTSAYSLGSRRTRKEPPIFQYPSSWSLTGFKSPRLLYKQKGGEK